MSETNETTTLAKVVANPRSLILAAIILAIGMTVGGYLLGDGLLRAKAADRAVTVRGLAERDVMSDLATWTISYSAEGASLAAVQAEMDRDTETIYAFFREAGFDADALSPSGVNVNEYVRNGQRITSISQRLHFRTDDIEGAQRVAERQFELARRGVSISDGSGLTYTFTGLNEIKPEMIAAATRDARAGAERFAEDSGTNVGSIKTATQGYFSIQARDGEGGYGAGDRPGKKVRVVTTIQFYLD